MSRCSLAQTRQAHQLFRKKSTEDDFSKAESEPNIFSQGILIGRNPAIVFNFYSRIDDLKFAELSYRSWLVRIEMKFYSRVIT